jgi:hypothetical protein
MSVHQHWKTEPDEEKLYRSPTPRQLAEKINQIDREIRHNLNRLSCLVLSEEDRWQTEDYIADLRNERESLAWCYHGIMK